MSDRYIDWYGKGRAQNWQTPRDLFERLHAEFEFTLDGASEPGNGLVPARTNVAWFHRALELGATPRFFPKRPCFELPGHPGSGHNSPVDCMFLVFDNRAAMARAA